MINSFLRPTTGDCAPVVRINVEPHVDLDEITMTQRRLLHGKRLGHDKLEKLLEEAKRLTMGCKYKR